jgi:superfamily II DNA or RNA helicase
MQLAWADTVHRHTGRDVLILAPLAVAEQTAEEGASIGVKVNHAREDGDLTHGINITNYDRLHKFDTERFGGVVLDESSIIKHHNSKTLAMLMDAFNRTPYRLCATATPAPNDWTELGTHAEFLGIRSRAEMLAEYFVHDGGDTQTWRLKGHAKHLFWRWVSSWGALVRSPADLGHDASRYALPPLHVTQHTVSSGEPVFGQLFHTEAQTLMERREARRSSLVERVRACAGIINQDRQPWVVWCDLNAEGDALTAAIPDAVEIRGSDDVDVKERRLHDFAHGKIRVLVTKPSIAGFGLNWQHCARMAFVGVTDSFEAYYQAVRRCWRFGQQREVNVHIFASEQEGAVVANLQRKETEARAMAESLSAETMESVRSNVLGSRRESNPYQPSAAMNLPSFLRAA